jgi:hypothetical protein
MIGWPRSDKILSSKLFGVRPSITDALTWIGSKHNNDQNKRGVHGKTSS